MKAQPRLITTYIYPDGHAVQLFEKHDPDAGHIEFAVVTEKFTRAAPCNFTGRIVIGRFGAEGFVNLLREATDIEAKAPSITSGSDNTRSRNIAVGYLTIHTAKFGRLRWVTMPDLISDTFTLQTDAQFEEQFNPNLTRWGGSRVARIVRQAKPTSPPTTQVLCSVA